MKKVFLIALMAVCFSQIITAQNNAKIDVSLQQEMALSQTTDLIRINIILNQQYEQMEMRMKASIFPTKEARRSFVVSELKRFSEETQRGVMDLLSTMPAVSEVQSCWIANFINCYANIEAIEELSLHPDVLIIGFDKEQYLLPEGEPSATTDETRELTYNVTKVNAHLVWELGYEGEGVIVAVLDTGVNYNHNDLKTHMWQSGDTGIPNHGWNFANNNNNPMDGHGHGTHCAGTVAGDGASGSQTGMAPSATIMALKVLDNGGYGNPSNVCNAMAFGIEHGAHVFSMSVGWANPSASDRLLFRNAMNNVLEAGIIASVAAGNERQYLYMYPIPQNVRTPGDCPPPWLHPDQTTTGSISAVVCVGATDINDNIGAFSSSGPVTWQTISGYNDYPYNPGMGLIRPDVSAPGVNIKSLAYNSNSGYASGWDGTSMATPCVAGVMALMLCKNPELTPAEICEIIETTAVRLPNSASPKGNLYGSGRINALEAVNTVQDATPGIVFEDFIINDIDGNNNGRLNPGETVHLTVSMRNAAEEPINDVQVTFTTSDALITIVNGTADFGNFAAGEVKTVEDAFTITLSESALNGHTITAQIEAAFEGTSKKTKIVIPVYDYILNLLDIKVANDKGEIEAGETSDIRIYLKDTGGEIAYDLNATLTTTSSYLTINETTAYYGHLYPAQYKYRIYNVTLSPNVPAGTTYATVTLTVTDEAGRITKLSDYFRFKNFGQPPLLCNPIENLSAEITGSDIILTWTAPSGSTPEKYVVYYNDLFIDETTTTTYTLTDTGIGIQKFCVEPIYDNGCTGELSCVEVIAPCNVAVELTLDSEFRLSWLPVMEDVTFRIYKNSEFLIEVEGNEYIDTEINGYVEYCYTVTAVCPGNEESEHSNEECGVLIGIDELGNDIKIYPNPVSGELQVTSYKLQVESVDIIDMMGRTVGANLRVCPESNAINLAHLENGVYFLRITTDKGVITKKIVKQ